MLPFSGRSNMSKEELHAIIENQADQIKRFELRLRDTVSACKNLMKQKEALEASLQVLNQQKQENNEENANDVEPSTLPGPEADYSEDPSALRQQLFTLSTSLATITAEKVRLEQVLIAEKKSIRSEYEAKIENILAEKDRYIEEIRELRFRLESPNGSDGNDFNLRQERMPPKSLNDYQTDSYMPGQPLIERLRIQLREAEAKIFTLEQECATKNAETFDIETEREKAERAETLAFESERRLRVLETRTAELTDEIGRLEKTKHNDKILISKLETKIRDMQVLPLKSQVSHHQHLTLHTASFGTQTDVPDKATSLSPAFSKPQDCDHSFCNERIITLEGALAMARKDFADAVARSWFAGASNNGKQQPSVATEVKLPDNVVQEPAPPDILLRLAPKLRPEFERDKEKNVHEIPSVMQQSNDSVSLETSFNVHESNFDESSDHHDHHSQYGCASAAPLLFYETELSRLDQALKESRSTNRRLERRFRETEQRLVAEKLALQQSLDKLETESSELKRATTALPPDVTKIEFIRQVLMRHFSTNDLTVRAQTATVLATALSFPEGFLASNISPSSANAAVSAMIPSNLSKYFKS